MFIFCPRHLFSSLLHLSFYLSISSTLVRLDATTAASVPDSFVKMVAPTPLLLDPFQQLEPTSRGGLGSSFTVVATIAVQPTTRPVRPLANQLLQEPKRRGWRRAEGANQQLNIRSNADTVKSSRN